MQTTRRTYRIRQDGTWLEVPQEEDVRKNSATMPSIYVRPSAPEKAAYLVEGSHRRHIQRPFVQRRRTVQNKSNSWYDLVFFAVLACMVGLILVHFSNWGGGQTADLPVPLSEASVQQLLKFKIADKMPLAVADYEHQLLPLTASSDALILPPLSVMMYEGGTFGQKWSALSAGRDYASSGVTTYPVQAGHVTKLLLGPTIASLGDTRFESMLNRAQVPFFVEPFQVQQWSVPLPGVRNTTATQIEDVILHDLQLLQGMIAVQAGYAVTALPKWDAVARRGETEVAPELKGKLGSLGESILQFHDSVLSAESIWLGSTSTGGEKTMRALTKAIVLYSQIGK